jgi:hypothetical protein
MEPARLRIDLLVALLSAGGWVFAFGCGSEPETASCTPECSGLECGDDGCGGSCGFCATGETCRSGTCQGCVPSCTDRVCGDDGCGGSCGTCAAGTSCVDGACVAGCTPDCTDRVCGDDGCGGSCGTCAAGTSCVDGACVAGCTPDCTDRVCGDDGCGGSCGTCAPGSSCVEGACVADCTPDCTDKACGDDGCGGSCGQCGANESCQDGVCVAGCTPDCTGKACGGDGCGGSCGTCPTGESCDASGQCTIDPVVFTGGTLDQLRQIRPTLEFGDLTVNGVLVIPADEMSVTITGRNLTFTQYIDTRYPTCSEVIRSGPNLTLDATGQVRLEGGVDLAGKRGEEETSTTQCHNCTGGRGGDLSVDAASIYVGGGLDLEGGGGSRYRSEPSWGYGCNGGDGGDLTLRASASLVADTWDVDLEGGDGGYGLGSGAPDGVDGSEGALSLSSPSVALTEHDGLNAFPDNAQRIPYVVLDLTGDVNFADDYAYRESLGPLWRFIGQFQDYLEDLYRIDVPRRMTFDATLRFSSYDLDLYLINEAGTAIVLESNGTTRPESFSGVVNAGTYYLAVSFSDDNTIFPSPVPYTLELR